MQYFIVLGMLSIFKLAKANGLGTSDFQTIRKSNYFVDKTLFIEAFMSNKETYQYVTAPSGFGKSTNLDMLTSFLSIQVDDNGTVIKTGTDKMRQLFKGTQIFDQKSFVEKHFQKYVIIPLDLSNISEITNGADFPLHYCRFVCQRKSKCITLYKLDRIFPEDPYFAVDEPTCNFRCQQNSSISEGRYLSEKLSEHFKKKVMLLGDGFDSISDTFWTRKHSMTEKTTISNYINMFVSDLIKGNKSVWKALFVGSTTLGGFVPAFTNNIKHISFDRSENYWQFFGFTTDNVKFLLDKHGLTHKMCEVTEWYDGYTVPAHPNVVLFNSYSIVQYVIHKKPGYYWIAKVPPLDYLIPFFTNREIGRDVELILFGKSELFTFDDKGAKGEAIEQLKKDMCDPTGRKCLTDKQITMVIQHLTEKGYLSTDRFKLVSNLDVRCLKPASKETRKVLELNFFQSNFYLNLLRYTQRKMDVFAEALYNLTEDQTSLQQLAKAIHHVFQSGYQSVHNGRVGMLGPLYGEIKYQYQLREKFPIVESVVRVYHPNGSFSTVDLMFLTDRGDANVIEFRRKLSATGAKPVVAKDFCLVFKQAHVEEKVKHKRFMSISLDEECTCEITSLYETFDSEKNITVQFPPKEKEDKATSRMPKNDTKEKKIPSENL